MMMKSVSCSVTLLLTRVPGDRADLLHHCFFSLPRGTQPGHIEIQSAMRSTCSLRFYKSHRSKSMLHPARRWVYLHLFGYLFAGTTAITYASYRWAGVGQSHDDRLCSAGFLHLMEALPLSYVSAIAGSIASSPTLPESTHRTLMEWYVWWYGVDMQDVDGTLDSFPTMESFFVRSLKKDVRPVDSVAVLVSPVDGEVMSVGDAVAGSVSTKIVQVKGASYTLQNLMRIPVAPLPHGMERKYIVFRLRAQDYHHVHSPATLQVLQTVYVPGNFLPMTLCGYRWLPNILVSNERVCFQAVAVNGASVSAPQGNLWMALVGGTLRGKIDVRFEGRVNTHVADSLEYAVHWQYKPGEKTLIKGDDIARFRWGSAVVVVADVPQGTTWTVSPGNVVKVGQPLTTTAGVV